MVATRARRRSEGSAERIVDGLYRIRLGFVGAYLLESDEGLVLIDSGEARTRDQIIAAISALGRTVGEVHQILVTHRHPDHIGGLAELARRTGAPVYVHAADAPVVRGEAPWPDANRATIAGRVLGPLLVRMNPDRPEPAGVDHELEDGGRLPVAGGVQIVHTPGHTPGHVAFLLARDGGILIAGDAATNIGRLRRGDHWLAGAVTHDGAAARASFRRLAGLDFEIAVFGHGSPILSGAAECFRAADQ